MKLKANTSVESLKRRLGASDTGALRASPRRERYLEKVGRMISKADVKVRLHNGGAKCVSPDNSDLDAIILLPVGKYEQPKTSLPEDAWDLLFQETELFHELGHVLFTSWEALAEVMSDVENRYEKLFKGLANAIEDGAIETQLANSYNVDKDLTVKNANLAALADRKVAEDAAGRSNGEREYTLREAVEIGLLDMGYYDSGRFGKIRDDDCTTHRLKNAERTAELLEEMLPHMEAVMADCLSEPDGEARMHRVYEFWEQVKPYFEQTSQEDQQKNHEDCRPDDADNMVMTGSKDADDLPDEEQAQQHVQVTIAIEQNNDDTDEGGDGGDADEDVLVASGGGDNDEQDNDDEEAGGTGGGGEASEPEQDDDDADSAGGGGGAQDEDTGDEEGEEADGGDGDADEEGDEDASSGGGEDSDEEAGSDEEGSGDADADGDGEGEDSEDDTPAGQVGDDELEQMSQDVGQKYQNEAENERKQDQGSDTDTGTGDAAEYVDILSSGDNDLRQMEVVEPDQYRNEYDEARWQEAKRKGEHLVSVLEAMLQREREDELRTGQKSGRLDTQSLYKTGVGNGRVFTRHREPDTKDYSCIIILDRSSSMSGDDVIAAEEATAQLVYGLDEVGVDVSVLGMYDEIPSLEIPFNVDVEQCANRLMTGRTSGTTPLHDMLAVARERIERGEGDEPFVVIVTDGAPDKKRRYKDELEQTNFDVWGVYIDNSGKAEKQAKHQQYFDRIAYANHDNISRKLRQIAQRVMK